MYGYKPNLTLDSILSKYGEESIFSMVFKEGVYPDRKYTAPYRTDRNPACYFEKVGGVLYFVDFANSKPSLNCFSFIRQVFQLNSFEETLLFIENNISKEDILKPKNFEATYRNIVKINRPIFIVRRDWDTNDAIYWKKYHISRLQLEEDGVAPILAYRSLNKVGVEFTITRPIGMYAYTDFPEGRKKIYSPKEDKFKKWFTNCTQNDIGGINKLEGKPYLIITKSYKDYRVLKNTLKNADVVWFQNEGQTPIASELKKLNFKKRRKVYIFFDSDSTGILRSKSLVEILKIGFNLKNVQSVHTPLALKKWDIKDPSDFIAKNKEEYTLFIQSINKKFITNN